MKDTIITPRDVRLELANLLDRLGQVQNTETWESTATTNKELQNRMSEAIVSMDNLWFLWRSLTAKNDE